MDSGAGGADRLQSSIEQRAVALLDHLPGMVFRCRFGGDWKLEFVAGAVHALTGYRAEQLLCDPPAQDTLSAIHPDDRARFWDCILAAARSGRAYTLEYRMITAGGVEKWVWERGRVIPGPDGRAVALEGFTQDVSEQRRAVQQLAKSERLLRLVVETEPECVKRVGPDGRLIEMNRAGLAMLECDSLDQAQQQPLSDFVAPEYRAAFRDLHRRVLSGQPNTLEFQVIGRRGTRRWLETHAVPLRDDDGEITALLGVTRDITEQRTQRERLLRLGRVRAVMSTVNALIIRARSRTELFQEACRIAVEEGGFGHAAVVLLDEASASVAAASSGDPRGQVSVRIPPSGLVEIQAGKPWVSNRLDDDSYGSAASYPLMVGGQALARFDLRASEVGFFDGEEMALLAELAADLSYALEFIVRDERLDFLELYDPLTRLPNRNLFLSRLPGYIEAAHNSSRRLALLILDIERFKAINDAVGQEGGDRVLKLVAERLRFHAGGGYVARLSSDRFAAVVPGLDRNVDVDALARTGAWDRIDPPYQHRDHEFNITFKVGLAVFPQDGADAEALLRHAELALKHGKAAGTRHTRYSAGMSEVAARKLRLGSQLRRALERNELRLHYQAKADLRTGLICGAEALLRWQSADLGLVLPGAIVPLMEETGLILEVGRWALREAVRQRQEWLEAGLAAPRVAVNVSAVQLRERDFVASVRDAIALAPQAAQGIELEVTESMMMSDPDAHVATLRTLRGLGVTVALDDFGTGYSSLGYLARLPLNAVKIDRSFVDAMVHEPDTMNIVSSIIALAHSMNLRVVAEGVETADQTRYLRLLRCDEAQGFLLSQPLPADGFAELLRRGGSCLDGVV